MAKSTIEEGFTEVVADPLEGFTEVDVSAGPNVFSSAPTSALTGELGRLKRPGGGFSTELSITVTDKRLNQGRPTNIPSLVTGQINISDLLAGTPITQQQNEIAIQRATTRVSQGANLPFFDSIDEAVTAAKSRSESKNLDFTVFAGPSDTDISAISHELATVAQAPSGKARPFREEALDGLTTGLLRMGSAGVQAAASFFETPGTYFGLPRPESSSQRKAERRIAESLRGKARFLHGLSQDPDLAMQNTDAFSKLVRMASETGPYIAMTTGATILLGPAGGFTVGSLVEGNNSYQTTLDFADKMEAEGDVSGAQNAREMAPSIAIGVGIFSGAIESVGGGIADDVLRKLTTKFSNKIIRGGITLGIGSLIEGLEEAGQELTQITGESKYRDVPWDEVVNRTLQAGEAGVALGGVFRGASVSARGVFGPETSSEGRITPEEEAAQAELGTDVEQIREEGGVGARQRVFERLSQEEERVEHVQLEDDLTSLIMETRGVSEEEARAAAKEGIDKKFFPEEEAGVPPISEAVFPVETAEQTPEPDAGVFAEEISPTEPAEAKMTPTEPKPLPKEESTPPAVQKEMSEAKTGPVNLTADSQNAVNLLDEYWKFKDEADLEADVAADINQEKISDALGKRRYDPETQPETALASQAMMLNIDLKEHPSGHGFVDQLSDEQKQAYELSQNLPPELQQIADSIATQNRQSGQFLKDQDVIRSARENYIAHIWEQPTTKEQPIFAKFRQKTSRRLPRTLEGGIMEGWAKGLNLRVGDVTEASQIARQQGTQALAGKKLLDMGKDLGLMSHTQREGWEQVEHPNFTYWRKGGQVEIESDVTPKKGSLVRPSDRKNFGKVTSVTGNEAVVFFRNTETGAEATKTFPLEELEVVRPVGKSFFITDEGVLMEKTPVYATPELAKKLNKIFSTSGLFKVPGVKTITKYNAQIKSVILSTSLFHHQAFLRSTMLGSRTANPAKAYKTGKQAIRNLEPELRLLVRNGMTIGKIQDYDSEIIHGEQTIWGRVLSSNKLTEKGRKALVSLRNRQEKFLFNKFGPNLKAGSAVIEFRAEVKKNKAKLDSGEITVDEIAKSVATLMNNDFGGLHLGRLERGATAQHLFRLLALAPDWTESNVRSMAQMLNKGQMGKVHRHFWGRIAAKGLGATIALNLMLSGFDDEDFKERYKKAWEEGRLRWLDVDITPIYRAAGGDDDKRKYFSLIGHFRDPVKFVARPGLSIKHKTSVFGRLMWDYGTGQDWAGREFTSIGDLLGISDEKKLKGRLVKWSRGKASPVEWQQAPSFLAYEARSSMPIQVQNTIAYLGGELDAFDAITKSLGLMTATTFPEKDRGVFKKSTGKKKGIFKKQ